MNNQRYFPLFIDLTERKIVVVGGGKTGTRRVKALLPFTRNITVIAPELTADLRALAMAGHIQMVERPVKKSDFLDAFIVLAVTNDWKLNDTICKICRDEGIYVNTSNDREESDFLFPGICTQDDLVVGISSGGRDHHRARVLRAAVQKMMEQLPSYSE